MITCRRYRSGTLEGEPVGLDELGEASPGDGPEQVWVDVERPTDDELDRIQRRFGLHPLSIEDARHWGQRPKVEFFPEYFSVVLHRLWLDDGDELKDSELHVLVGEGFLMTLRGDPAFPLDPVKERVRRQPELVSEGARGLLYLLLDEVVDEYLSTVERFEDLSDDLEDRVFESEGDIDMQQDIFSLKRKVTRMRRLVSPMREMIDLMQEQPGYMDTMLAPYYRDVLDHVLRTIEFLDNIRDLLTTALEAQLAQVSNRLNVVMKKLTSWAGIVLVPTLLAGIWGMNFENMPELSWRLGYPLALGSMAISMLLLYRAFKRQGWL